MRDLLRAIFAECAAVAGRLGISFPVSLDRRLEAGLAVGDHKTSMLQDLEAAKAGARLHDRERSSARGLLGVDVHTTAVHACTKLLGQLTLERGRG